MSLINWAAPNMGLQRRNPVSSLEYFFNDFFSKDLLSQEFAGYVPGVNIREKEKSYSIEVSAPGFEKNDFKVEVQDGVLTISGEHKTEKKEEEKNYVRREFNYGSFKRSFNLVDLVDEEKIDAKYENGVLKIELPKNEKTTTRNIKQIKIS
jgi:HSP20 family protein